MCSPAYLHASQQTVCLLKEEHSADTLDGIGVVRSREDGATKGEELVCRSNRAGILHDGHCGAGCIHGNDGATSMMNAKIAIS